MTYRIQHIQTDRPVSLGWNADDWKQIPTVELAHYMGNPPLHFPRVEVKLVYSDLALYSIFRVEDQHVRATTKAHQGPVYEDSCVELFFTPEANRQQRYFNLEVNCSGKILFHYQSKPRNGISLPDSSISKIDIASTLPSIIEPENNAPLTWLVAWRLPFEVLSAYPGFTVPQSGTVWHGNFYKCADKSSHPHWLTWAEIDHPKPDFHRPDCFGELIFE